MTFKRRPTQYCNHCEYDRVSSSLKALSTPSISANTSSMLLCPSTCEGKFFQYCMPASLHSVSAKLTQRALRLAGGMAATTHAAPYKRPKGFLSMMQPLACHHTQQRVLHGRQLVGNVAAPPR